MAYNEHALRGVGGWLAFFILTLAVFTPLSGIFMLIAMHRDLSDPSWAGVVWWSTATGAIGIAGCLWMARLLYRVHERRTVNIVRIGLWLAGPVLVLVDVVAIAALIGSSIGAVLSATALDVIRPVIYATIWTLYLSFSRRVANTYTDGDPMTDSLVFE